MIFYENLNGKYSDIYWVTWCEHCRQFNALFQVHNEISTAVYFSLQTTWKVIISPYNTQIKGIDFFNFKF